MLIGERRQKPQGPINPEREEDMPPKKRPESPVKPAEEPEDGSKEQLLMEMRELSESVGIVTQVIEDTIL